MLNMKWRVQQPYASPWASKCSSMSFFIFYLPSNLFSCSINSNIYISNITFRPKHLKIRNWMDFIMKEFITYFTKERSHQASIPYVAWELIASIQNLCGRSWSLRRVLVISTSGLLLLSTITFCWVVFIANSWCLIPFFSQNSTHFSWMNSPPLSLLMVMMGAFF